MTVDNFRDPDVGTERWIDDVTGTKYLRVIIDDAGRASGSQNEWRRGEPVKEPNE